MSSQPGNSRPGRARRRYAWLLFAVIGTVAGAWLGYRWWAVPDAAQIREALAARRFNDVVELASRRLRRFPADAPARLALGEVYQRRQQVERALATFEGVPQSAGADAVAARIASASMLIHQGRLVDAETALDRAAEIDPGHPLVEDLRATLYTLTGQRWLSLPVLQRILVTPHRQLSHMIYLANPDEMPAPPDDLFRRMFQVGDALGLLGAAHVAASLGRSEQAIDLIGRCLEQRPDLVDAYVLKGTILIDESRLSEFDRLVEQTPEAAQSHPGYWFNLGRRAHQQGETTVAIRCYWETLRRQPNHDPATYQLGQALSAHGDREAAQRFLDRARKLARLLLAAVEIFDGRQDDQHYWDCAQMTFELGRLSEARVWCELLLARNPQQPHARALLHQMDREWASQPPPLLPEQDLAASFPGDKFPLPTRSTAPVAAPVSSAVQKSIRFEDLAEESGLKFVYFSGDDPNTPGKRMFEYTGGGVAILDYDCDGWPDAFLTQGSSQPGDLSQRDYRDVLFRNERGRGWTEVGASAGIDDFGFGQGAAVGDFDNDGFPDLYLANIDGNRLFHNRGDGTFADVTAAAGLGHGHWTTSCLLADINDDGIVDVYDVTFLEGEDVFDRMCAGNDGVMRSCAPQGFPAAPDQVYFGRGDGTFALAGDDVGLQADDGDGLGIVVADFDHSGRLSVFIANDGRANFLFVPEPSTGPIARWQEAGVLSGVAFDEIGAAQACMGVAASDANNDGLVDLFVTNFYMESNAFYVNLGGLAFADRARTTGLREPSMAMLGFGTQFLDADRDGWEDLLLVNGHVDDFTYKDIPYKMPAQFFANHQGRFEELPSAAVGSFFRELRLGRGLATLDWNRDGLMDALSSNIGDPAALLTNRSPDYGQGISLKLVGRQRSRDAIGTRVLVRSDGRTLERQLTAGDGYQASNERRLIVGLGQAAADSVELEIIWPGGVTQQFVDVPVGAEYSIVEGHAVPVAVPR